MSLFRARAGQQQRALGDSPTEIVPIRSLGPASIVTPDSALRHSAVWGALNIRGNIISTLPINVYRQVGDLQVEVSRPGWLDSPMPGVDITEWMFSTQFDLDRMGNSFALITARDGFGLPAQFELLDASKVKVIGNGPNITAYKVNGGRGKVTTYDPAVIWHERQYTVAGLPVGLCPIAYAAWSIGAYESAQQFSVDWFSSGAFPAGILQNVEESELQPKVAAEAKARFKASVSGRDIFVTGKDWEFKPQQMEAAAAAFLESMNFGVVDVARFMGVPADLLDGVSGKSSITYANVTQRNLQLLQIHLNAPIVRRERALSKALPSARTARLDESALLRMDPAQASEVILRQVAGRILTPTEARAANNLPPLTEAQKQEFVDLMFAPPAPGPMAPTITQKPEEKG